MTRGVPRRASGLFACGRLSELLMGGTDVVAGREERAGEGPVEAEWGGDI